MVERLMILKTTPDEAKEHRLIKSDSMNTDDDDSVLSNDQQTNLSESQTSLVTPKDRLNLSAPQLQQTPSFEFSNDQDENPLEAKIKKKKQRRMTDQTSGERRRSSVKQRPWYTKIDLTKPILFVLLICLIYLMWAERNVWIPRLLTSNSRIRRVDLTKRDDNDRSTSTTSKHSLHKDADEEEKDSNENPHDDDDSDTDDGDDEQDDDSRRAKHKKSKDKLNIKTRRNKMSFGKDSNERKHRRLKHKLVDDDDDDDDNDGDGDADDNPPISAPPNRKRVAEDDDDDDDDKDARVNQRGKKKTKKSIEVATSKPTKTLIRKPSEPKTNILFSAKEDLVEQMTKLIQSRDRKKNVVKILSKQTGLNKKKISKLIQKKDYRLITLENLITFLNRYHSTLLIVSK